MLALLDGGDFGATVSIVLTVLCVIGVSALIGAVIMISETFE